MTNWLETDQAKQENIQWISASCARYNLAAHILLLQLIFVVALPVILSIIKSLISDTAEWVAVYGLFIYFIDITGLEPQLMKNLKKGALAQEHFDCTVLQIGWNELGTGNKPSRADAVAWAGGFKYDDPNPWYPIVAGTLSIEMGRLICQLSSCMWDSRLRRRYSILLLVITIIFFAILLILFIKRPVENFLFAGIAWLPVINWLIRSSKNQRTAAIRGEVQKNHIEKLWSRALDGNIDQLNLAQEARVIQDSTFRRRADSQRVFNCIYKAFRSKDQATMNTVASAMVEEYKVS